MSKDMTSILDERVAKLPEEEQFLISTCAENILNGSHWGFVTRMAKDSFGDATEYNNELTKVYSVGKYHFIEAVDAKTTLKVLKKVMPEVVDKSFVDDYLAKLTENMLVFRKWLEKISKSDAGDKFYIGVNSINKTSTMTFNGNRHKAFQIPLSVVIKELGTALGKRAYIYINGELVSLSDLSSKVKGYDGLFKLLQPSEGNTSVVLPIVVDKKK